MDFKGKTILVTGSGTGIGAATAELLASIQANVVILGPDRAPLEEVAAKTGAIALVGDAADSHDVQAALALAKTRFGGLDGLAACAGGGGIGRLTDVDDAGWRRAMHITLDTAMVSARECLPGLIERKGAIVLVSSVGGLTPPPASTGYATAKAALIGLARSLAHDYGPEVRVNTVCPGLTASGMGDAAMGGLAQMMKVPLEEAYTYATRWFPLKRAAQPVEISKVIAFLLSDWSGYMTGATVIVDGGASAIGPTV